MRMVGKEETGHVQQSLARGCRPGERELEEALARLGFVGVVAPRGGGPCGAARMVRREVPRDAVSLR